jgi:hypothetical protein
MCNSFCPNGVGTKVGAELCVCIHRWDRHAARNRLTVAVCQIAEPCLTAHMLSPICNPGTEPCQFTMSMYRQRCQSLGVSTIVSPQSSLSSS